MDFSALGLLFLRSVFGGIMAWRHGFPKLLNFTNSMHSFPDPFGVGSVLSLSFVVFAEFFCAVLVFVGIFTRFTVIPLIIVMAVAFFIIHGNDAFVKKEMAFLYLTVFSCILASGPGRYSVDALIRGKR